MSIKGRKIAITGAGRSLGAALAVVAADGGANLLLLGRSLPALARVAGTIEDRAGIRPATIACDLADLGSVEHAAAAILREHGDVDVLVNSGARWLGGSFADLADADIAATVNSMLTGTLALTRRLLPALRARPRADIHTVVSMSGLQYARLRGASLAFRAAKAGQDGFVQGLVEELAGTNVRTTASYPGIIEDISPLDPAWDAPRSIDAALTNKDVVEAIIFALGMPAHVAIRSLVIERNRSDFLT
ncbi:MAG: SDR family NAD(P)-dependent oxidoreductase [Devosia sp.]|nr:SDR family NAD(P)-dependent oxidoreductase [Devosia sp.]